MKLSVSLRDEAVEFIDRYADERGVPSRSAVVQRAVDLLRASELGDAYTEAWSEWDRDLTTDVWDTVTGDGLAPRTNASR
jgi:Arc/MetJ-type ribon-helix-helix transcriptional regulator